MECKAMNIIKRSGKEVCFEAEKIQSAVERANRTVKEEEHLTKAQIAKIVQAVTAACVEEMLACKEEPPVFISLNIDGNEDVNEAYFEKYTRLY